MSDLSQRRTASDNAYFPRYFEQTTLPPASEDRPLPDVVTGELVGGRRVFLYGAAGIGKTFLGTLAQKVIRDTKKITFCISIDVKKVLKEKPHFNSGPELTQYLEKIKELELSDTAKFLHLLEHEPQQIVFIFDNVDELPKNDNNVHYLHHLLTGTGARLFLGRHLSQEISADENIKMCGFRNFGTALEFIQYQLSTVHKISKSQPLVQYLKMQPIIMELCTIPRMALILVVIYVADNKIIKDTVTMVVSKMVLKWVEQAAQIRAVKSLYKLPADKKEHLLHIAWIAFRNIMYSRNGSFSLDPTEISHMNLQEGYSSLEEVLNFDLIQCRGNTVQSFLSPIIQEFLAGFHLSYLPQDQQIAFYYETFPKNIQQFYTTSLFHFGLTRLETEDFLNSSKLILAGMIESLGHVAMKHEEIRSQFLLDLQKLILACLYEAQDPTLVTTFTQQHPKLMAITFQDVRALDDSRITTHLTYIILQSGIDLWEIEIPHESARGKTDVIILPISMAKASIKVAIRVKPNPQLTVTVRACVNMSASKGTTGRATEMLRWAKDDEEREFLFQHAMQCTGRRETFHRLAQLYSPVPIKSSAADPAYSSLITCGCVEEKLAGDVLFEPIHPIHTVSLSSKSRKAKAADGDRDATAQKHIQTTHQNSYMEVIVLNKPSVKSITFQPPGGVQQCRLVMSGEKLSSPMSGRIAMQIEADKLLGNFVTCTEATESGGTGTTMICHGLPLPKSKTKVEADKANALQTEETAETRVHDNTLRVPITAAQVAPSHKNFLDADTTLFSPTPTQAESSEKVVWRPGMIMFTTIPDVFQKLKSYALPIEDHQIRRGGNGQIFSADYLGYALAAKKTLFRNREYNIIIRLKHPNIVPLLALMVGEVSHRKRFFCYHMLPRMSGDVARMLSDHPELTLAALKQTNSDNPRQFGLALGNMRYLLAEVLKGLAYMHSLHIIHRDVKSSNILVRFHCHHENLLWCTCPHKYTVCVCDFDAAVELGPNDEMLPISQSNPMFYLPPVGTQGFRSPEGSQLVVASHSDVIAPSLTPQSDIWSFGILMLRLFTGEDGPSTQRQNSMLLLRYHQTVNMAEGRTRHGRLYVMDREVEKLLKLPILRKKLGAVNNLVNFVTSCLQLDPHQRPTAKSMLKDPFLY